MRNLFGGLVAAALMTAGTAAAQTAPPQEPALSFGGIDFSGTVFGGYYRDGYGNNGPILRSDFNLKGEHGFDNGIKVGFSTDIDVIARGKNPYAERRKGVRAYLDDFTIWADFGAWGKLSYTSEGHCTNEEADWFDGEFYSENNTSIWNIIPPNFRCVGGRSPLAGFPKYSLPADDYLKYEFKSGKFGLEAYYDHNQSFTDHRSGHTYSGRDAVTTLNGQMPPKFELNLSYAFDLVSVTIGGNNLGDRFIRLVKPLPDKNLLLVASREWQEFDGANPLTIFYADWQPKDMGVFRGASFLLFLDDSNPEYKESYVTQIKLGGDLWQANIAFDIEEDWAIETAYEINGKLRLLVGYDNGMRGSNGMDRFFPGAPDPNVGWRFAEDRGSSWEAGLEMKF